MSDFTDELASPFSHPQSVKLPRIPLLLKLVHQVSSPPKVPMLGLLCLNPASHPHRYN